MSGPRPPPHLKKDINNYSDFLLQQEERKQTEITQFEASRKDSTAQSKGEDKAK